MFSVQQVAEANILAFDGEVLVCVEQLPPALAHRLDYTVDDASFYGFNNP